MPIVYVRGTRKRPCARADTPRVGVDVMPDHPQEPVPARGYGERLEWFWRTGLKSMIFRPVSKATDSLSDHRADERIQSGDLRQAHDRKGGRRHRQIGEGD